MNVNQVARTLLGSVVVYFVVAACAAEEQSGWATLSSSGTGVGADGASGGNTTSGGGSGHSSGMVSPVPDALAESGSRLKAVSLVGEDGSKQWANKWRDTERNEDCTFGVTEGGVMRCLPTDSAFASVGYADSSCTEELIAWSVVTSCPAPPLPSYFVAADDYCSTSRCYLRPGPAINAEHYYFRLSGACSQAVATTGVLLYRINEEVPTSVFVAAVEEVEP